MAATFVKNKTSLFNKLTKNVGIQVIWKAGMKNHLMKEWFRVPRRGNPKRWKPYLRKIDSKTENLGQHKGFDSQFLADRGFLRNAKPYSPLPNVNDILNDTFNKYLNGNWEENTSVSDLKLKFKVLTECENKLGHNVPNNQLNEIKTVSDIVNFFNTPVNVTTPLDAMKSMDLPKNLHVLYDYIRFNPESDTKFGGISAFPGSSTVVTGLKYKKKYAGYKAKVPQTWIAEEDL